jgi:hypothetical protein
MFFSNIKIITSGFSSHRGEPARHLLVLRGQLASCHASWAPRLVLLASAGFSLEPLPSPLSSQILLAGCPVVDGASSGFPPHRSAHLARCWRRRPDASPSFPPAEATQLEVVAPPPSAGTGKCRSAWAWIDSFFWRHRGRECTRGVMLSDSDASVDPSFRRCVWGIRWLCSEQSWERIWRRRWVISSGVSACFGGIYARFRELSFHQILNGSAPFLSH